MKTLKHFVTLFVILSLVSLSASMSFALGTEKSPSSANTAAEKLININTATADELSKLPRIGPKMSQRILEYRQQNGKFKKIEDIMKVKGIGEKTFKGFEKMITI